MNNFQRLEAEQEEQYAMKKRQAVQHNLLQSMGIFRFVGQIVDVYLPAMAGVLVSAAGGREKPPQHPSRDYRTPSEGGLPPGRRRPGRHDEQPLR